MLIEVEKERIAKEKEAIKKTPRDIFYENPDDCIVFKIAKNIYDKEFKVSSKEITKFNLDKILEEAIIFILRIFFIVYIEDNDPFKGILEESIAYKSYMSFRYFFYNKVIKREEGYSKLITIFNTFDKGNDLIKFPVFNR